MTTPSAIKYNGVTVTKGKRNGVEFYNSETSGAVLPTYDRMVALGAGNAYVVDFSATASSSELFERDPVNGILNRFYPLDMWTDDTGAAIERVRVFRGGDPAGNQSGEVNLHRGSSGRNWGGYLDNLSDDWTWYLVDEFNSMWGAWRANHVPMNPEGTVHLGGGFVRYIGSQPNLPNGLDSHIEWIDGTFANFPAMCHGFFRRNGRYTLGLVNSPTLGSTS